MHGDIPRADTLDFEARLRRTATTLHAMPTALARSMSITLTLGERDQAEVGELARRVARDLDLIATVEVSPPLVTVSFIRSGSRVVAG
ncbi:MAG: hypothetical protein NVS9B6_18310 [Candidatus Limnocylindrales bacterium]